MKKLLSFIIAAPIALIFALNPASAHAEVTNGYNGCFARTETETAATLWLQAPICSVSLTNDATTPVNYTFTIFNLDPAWYLVEESDGTGIPASRANNQLVFTVTVPASSTQTVNVSPWDYNASTRDFWFGAIADTQTTVDSDTPNQVAVTIMDQLESIRPPFTTIAGDIIGGEQNDEVAHDEEYQAYDEMFKANEGTNLMVPGNHDAYQSLDDYYSKYYGDQNYTFVYGNTRFIGINSNDDVDDEGRVVPEIFTWLEGVLDSATEENIIVYWHHPLVVPEYATETNGVPADQQLDLAQLLVDYNVDLLMVGHVHGYDDRIVDSSDIPGLQGTLHQIVMGGAGGKRKTYQGDHFFMMMHVVGNSIEAVKFDYSDFDLSIDSDQLNDGTETAVTQTIYNGSTVEVPYMRSKVNLGVEQAYARTSDNQFLPFTSAYIDGVLHGYVEMSLEPNEILQLTVKQYTNALTETPNTVSNSGVVTFTALPDVTAQETGISLLPSRQATVLVNKWDAVTGESAWVERTKAHVKTAYSMSALNPQIQYNVYRNNTFIRRLQPDALGNATFNSKISKKKREFRVVREHDRIAPYVGAMPSAKGGSNVSVFNGDGKKINSFFAFDQSLNGGFNSVWADLDGNADLEMVVAPKKGVHTVLAALEPNGTALAKVEPFGDTFKGGVQMVAADVNNDGKQEILVAADNNGSAIVQIYSYRVAKGKFKKIGQVRVLKEYSEGLSLTAGDVDGKKGDEIIVGPHTQSTEVFVYHWLKKKKVMRLWKSVQALNNANADNGVALTAGDVDFDGRDEIIVGSYSGSGQIQTYDYKRSTKELALLTDQQMYDAKYTGGVDLFVGNVDTNKREELLVVPKTNAVSQSIVKLYQLKNSTWEKLAHKQPFGDKQNGLHAALIDTNGDWKQELIFSREKGTSDIHRYRLKSGTMKLADSYSVYDAGFTGGIELTQ